MKHRCPLSEFHKPIRTFEPKETQSAFKIFKGGKLKIFTNFRLPHRLPALSHFDASWRTEVNSCLKQHRYPLSESQKTSWAIISRTSSLFSRLKAAINCYFGSSNRDLLVSRRSDFKCFLTKTFLIFFIAHIANSYRSDTCPTDTARGKPFATFFKRKRS